MPDPVSGQRWWLVGASAGLGRAVAHALHANGATVVLSARSADDLTEIARDLGDRACVVPVDVTDPSAVARAAEEAGDYDAVMYCAGFYEPVAATEWDDTAVRRMAEVNFTGALNVLAHAAPKLATAGRGRIVLIGSIAGFRGLPGAIGYGASKAAVMHLAENLRADLKGSGVTVQRINPGYIRTRLTEKNDFRMPQIMEPDNAANRVIRAIRSNRFSVSFPAPFAWLFTAGQHIPVAWFQRLI